MAKIIVIYHSQQFGNTKALGELLRRGRGKPARKLS